MKILFYKRLFRDGRSFLKAFRIGLVVLLAQIPMLVAYSQVRISGTVQNTAGEPLPSATVQLKGESNAKTTTDPSGRFSLQSPTEDDVIVISYVGYQTKEFLISDFLKSADKVISLEEESALSEVVVVGYGSQKKINLTGAVDQIGEEFFEDRPVPNATRAIQGAIPNLNIKMTDGRPTANPSFNVRGVTSIGAGGNALVLVDGVVADPINLNPNDIASVTVLKDAAASAIYGARAVFGVVLITTKSAKYGKTQLNYSANFSNNTRTQEPEIVWDAYTWAASSVEAYRGWVDYASDPASFNNYIPFSRAYLDSLKYRSEHPGERPEITIDPATGQYVYYGNTDWYSLLFAKNIPAMEHNLSASGSTGKLDYMISGRYYSQDGVFRFNSDKYNKYNLRFKGGVQLLDWLRIHNNMDFSAYDYTEPLTSNRPQDIWTNINNVGFPMVVLQNPDGSLTQAAAQGVGEYYYGKSRAIYKRKTFRNTVGLIADIIPNRLDIKADFTYQYSQNDDNRKVVPVPFSVRPNEILVSGQNYLNYSNANTNYYSANAYMDYMQSFGRHNVKALIGSNLEISDYRAVSSRRDNLILPDKEGFNLTTGQNFVLSSGMDQWATLGAFFRINYDYYGKYLVEMNGRYDGSSKFPSKQRFGFFPSFSAAWRVSEESFMQDTKHWLNDFKIRGSYGTLGNGQIASYIYLEQIAATQSSSVINGVFPTYISSPAVIPDDFTWESATTANLGLDFMLLRSRLVVNFDAYQRKTTGMITPSQPLPAVFGASVPRGNNADLETRGFELSVGWNDKIGNKKPFHYGLRFGLSDNRSDITKFYNPNNLISTHYSGRRVGDIWGYVFEDFFRSQEDIDNHADQSFVIISSGNILRVGDIKFKDLNGDGKIDKGNSTVDNPGDLKIIGNSEPRYMFSFNSNFSWNRIGLSFFFQGVGKRNWYPSYESDQFWGQYGRQYAILPKHTLNRWTEENPNGYFPRHRFATTYMTRQLGTPNTRYLQNVAYIRLKDITLSYTVKAPFLERAKVKDIRLFASGQNLFTYSPMFKLINGIDPETIELGSYQTTQGDGNVYPMLKTYTFGLNISL